MKELYYKRDLLPELEKWFERKEIIAVKGPRQAGKTTILKMLSGWLTDEKGVNKDNVIFLTFEDFDVLEKFGKSPVEFIKSFMVNKDRYYFLMDEFHYAEDGGKKLKLLYDTLENAKFVITGSSSMEITAFSKYLVGRVFSFYLMPFNFHEFLKAKDERLAHAHNEKRMAVRNFLVSGKDFEVKDDIFLKDMLKKFEEFAIYGGYPEVVKAGNEETRKMVLKNIYDTYIAKDVVSLLKIHDVFKFRKLVSTLSAQAGGIVNYNELSALCGSYYKEIVEMLNVLEETFVIRLVRPYHKNLKTELRKNPKVYFMDNGIRNYSILGFSEMEKRPDSGSLAENFVFTSLLDVEKDFGRISYWRTLSKAEVDFIIDTGEDAIPVEVKFSEMKKPDISRSFRSFIEAYKPKRGLILTKSLWAEKTVNGTNVKFVPVFYV
jgi:hypothetical protein